MDFREKYWCKTCDKLLPASPAVLKVGDKVSFTKVVSMRNGHHIRATNVTGIVAAVEDSIVRVRYRGELRGLAYKDCTPVDAPSALTYAFIGLCECKATVPATTETEATHA